MRSLNLGQSSSIAVRLFQTGTELARALGLRIPQDSLYAALQRLQETEEAVAATKQNLDELGRYDAVTDADVARYDSARLNLFAAETQLYIELHMSRAFVAALQATNQTIPAPVPQPAYTGPVRQVGSGLTEYRLAPRGGLQGLGAGAAAGAVAASPYFWAAVVLAALAVITAGVVVTIFLTSDTAGAVMGSAIMAASARLASYQRLLAVVACHARYTADETSRAHCVTNVIQAVPIQEDYRDLVRAAGGASPFWWILGTTAAVVGGYLLWSRYLRPRYFKGISGPRGKLAVGPVPRARALPRATMSRKDRYSHGGSLRVGGR